MLRCIDEAHGDIRDGLGTQDSLMSEPFGDDEVGPRPRAGDAFADGGVDGHDSAIHWGHKLCLGQGGFGRLESQLGLGQAQGV